jgi:tryptophanase
MTHAQHQTMGQQYGRRSWAEPWKIKMVEPIRLIGSEARSGALAEAGYNTFLLRSDDVYIDLLTDSGTSAMSDRQWAGLMLGDEAYAGSRNFYRLEEAMHTYYGYEHLIPTHQGRGAEHLISQAGTVNMAGGQPVSMANVKALRALCDQHGIAIYLDATRMAENAYFIQEREAGYADKSIAEILKEFCDFTDGAWMSAKKDHRVNIGGWLGVNDPAVAEQTRNMVVIYEGLHTYGGMAGRDMEALAIGISEAVQDDHMHARIGQVRYLGDLLSEWGIPIVRPIGDHAIFLDARRFYDHLRQDRCPAQTLAAQLYLDSGIRAMERASSARAATQRRATIAIPSWNWCG